MDLRLEVGNHGPIKPHPKDKLMGGFILKSTLGAFPEDVFESAVIGCNTRVTNENEDRVIYRS